MRKEDKAIIINKIAETLKEYPNFYLVETAGLNAEKTSELRRACAKAEVKLIVVKNTLLHKALEQLDGDFSELYPALAGHYLTDVHARCKRTGETHQGLREER